MQKGDGGRELSIWCLFNAISQEDCLFFINLRKRPSSSQETQFDLNTGTGNHGKCFYSSVFNQHLGHFFSPYVFSSPSEFSALYWSFPSGEKSMECLEDLEQPFGCLHCCRNWLEVPRENPYLFGKKGNKYKMKSGSPQIHGWQSSLLPLPKPEQKAHRQHSLDRQHSPINCIGSMSQ